MAHIDTPIRTGFFARQISKFAEAKVEQHRRILLTKTIQKLEDLNDSQLEDAGIDRDEIPQAAYRSVYQLAPMSQATRAL